MTKRIILFSLLWLSVQFVWAQETKNWSLSGYVTDMQSVMFDSIQNNWVNDNLIHNRLNFYWFPNDAFKGTVQLRNRLLWGETIKYTPDYAKTIGTDNGWADMSFNLWDEQSFLLNSTIDRLWLRYTAGNFEARIGRQRINWSQTFVWNPNDIFNTYSFFDFDYPEKPGSDAIRLQYYTGAASTIELAANVDADENVTAAGLFRFNKWGYDIQMLGGMLRSEDWLMGLGWSGYVKSAGLRGEISYFHPKENFADTTGLVLVALSADYMFSNSLYLQFEALYSDLPKGGISNFMEFYSGPLSVKKMSFTEYSLFAQGQYPITPLLNATLSGMYYPKISGYFVGPSVEYSISDNVYLSVFLQSFSGKFPDATTGQNKRQNFNLAFIRFKGSF